MAEGKKSFVLYTDYTEVFNGLSDSDAGQLIKHIFDYVNDKDPVTTNDFVRIAFINIKLQLKRDLDKWANTRVKRSDAGKIGAEAKASKHKQTQANADFAEHTQANQAVTDNVTVTVNDTVTVNNTKQPLTINIGNRKFSGTTSEWLMLNKEQAVEVLMMNEYPDLNREAVFATLDNSTVNYQFKDDNHPFNYFKSICNSFKSKAEKPPPYKKQVGKQTAIDILNINELAKHGISED